MVRALLPEPIDDVDVHSWYARDWIDGGGVRVNFVASVDGAATSSGLSRELQTPGDNRVFAALRDLADVVLVGVGTALAEKYKRPQPKGARLERRRAFGMPDAQRLALVTRTGSGLRPDLPLLAEGSAPRALIFTTEQADVDGLDAVADVVVTGADAVDFAAVRRELAERALSRVLCEGGPTIFGQAASGVDEVCLSVSPLLAGPGAGRITAGDEWTAARALHLAGVLEEDSALFLRFRTG